MPVVELRLIGPFGVCVDGREVANALGSRKGRRLLQMLAVQRGEFTSTDRIVDRLWPAVPPRRPEDNVATLVSRLRRVLGAEAISGDRGGYALANSADVHVDVAEVERLVGEAQARVHVAPALSMAAAGRALDLLGRGDLLEGEVDAEWAESARAAVRRLRHRGRLLAAEAALGTGDASAAQQAAQAAVVADPLDESATRLLMRAQQQAGEPAAALATYERLRTVLADELGTDPAPETRQLHVAVLQERSPIAAGPVQPAESVGIPAASGTLVGRDLEVQRLSRAWADAAAGQPAVWAVTGEAGIGKTHLTDEIARLAKSTGGELLRTRCYETERSLFLQPIVEAIAALVLRMPPARLRDLAGERAPVLSALVPEVAAVLGTYPLDRGTMEVERRRAYDAVMIFLRRLSAQQPVLLLIDDLHHAGLAVTGLLHYLSRHAGNSRLMVLTTVRTEEGAEALAALADVARRLELSALPAQAVTQLAAAAGHADRAEAILRRTGGHPLYVVETLRGLDAGEADLPETLQELVVARVRRAGPEAERVLRAAALLGSSFEPALVAHLLDVPPAEAVRRCEELLQARLVIVAGRAYEFAHDLVREVLETTTPAPTRLAYHQRAADLLTGQPEAMAAHAAAMGDWRRAARGWLRAAEHAMRRFAVADAQRLLDQAIDAGGQADDLEVVGRARLLRGHAGETLARYADAVSDYELAAGLARDGGDLRLQMRALRGLGGDAAIAIGQPPEQCLLRLEAGLQLAESLGDRRMQADLLARMAVLLTNHLRFAAAVEVGARAVAVARTAGDELALAKALDGAKTGYAYLGEVAELEPILAELEPLLRRQGDLWRLQWTLFESSFPLIAAADWEAASARIEAALAVNRRSGHVAYERWLTAHLGWVARLQGRYDDAVGHGRRAISADGERGHVWYMATAAAMLATTLLELGDAAEAMRVLRAVPAGANSGTRAYRLRYLAAQAQAGGSPAVLAQADELLRGIQAPAGGAWLLGADAYLGVARGWLAVGRADRAGAAVTPLIAAAERVRWLPALVEGALITGRCAAQTGDQAGARAAFARAADLAGKHRMAGIAGSARELLAGAG
ncbi:MAG: AAA family ATPase [Actinomycetota bacterium]|nr:AAA family ATPase [Actinomycetota bacterium]